MDEDTMYEECLDEAEEADQADEEQAECTPQGFFIDEDNYLWVGGDEPEKVGKAIIMSHVESNIDTGDVTAHIGFEYRGEIRELDVPRERLASKFLPELVGKGADCRADVAKIYEENLFKQEETVKLINVHSKVGWRKVGGKTAFLHARGIGIKSRYVGGQFDLGPSGTLEEWKQVIDEHVIGRPWLELMLAAGLSSAVVGMLALRTSVNSLLFHIFNRTTTGKTTAIRVGLSPWGNPDSTSNGLLRTWNGTDAGIAAHFRDNFGIAIGLDEASVRGEKQRQSASLVYQLAMGRDRDRLTGGSKRAETAEWATTMISNAEHSILDFCGKNGGIRARMFEIGGIQWTDGPEHAEALTEGLLEHYGVAGPEFARYLLDVGEEAVEELWKNQREVMMAKLTAQDKLSARVVGKLAIIAITGAFANAALDLSLDLERLEDTLLLVETMSQRERAEWARAYDDLKQIVTTNNARFINETFDRDKNAKIPSTLWGKFPRGKGGTEVNFIANPFKEAMKMKGYLNLDPIFDDWKRLGILQHTEKDRFSTNRKIAGVDNEVFVIRLDFADGSEETDDAGEEAPKPKVKVGSKRPVVRNRQAATEEDEEM